MISHAPRSDSLPHKIHFTSHYVMNSLLERVVLRTAMLCTMIVRLELRAMKKSEDPRNEAECMSGRPQLV